MNAEPEPPMKQQRAKRTRAAKRALEAAREELRVAATLSKQGVVPLERLTTAIAKYVAVRVRQPW